MRRSLENDAVFAGDRSKSRLGLPHRPGGFCLSGAERHAVIALPRSSSVHESLDTAVARMFMDSPPSDGTLRRRRDDAHF